MTNTQEVAQSPSQSEKEMASALHMLEVAAEYPDVYPLGALIVAARSSFSPRTVGLLALPEVQFAASAMHAVTMEAAENGTPIFEDADFDYGYPVDDDDDDDDYCQFCDCAHSEVSDQDVFPTVGEFNDFLAQLGLPFSVDQETIDILQADYLAAVGGYAEETNQELFASPVPEAKEEENPLADLFAALGIDANTVAVYRVDL